MERLVRKYAGKLVMQGLCEKNSPLFGGLDAELVWNRQDPICSVLGGVVEGLNINSILFARPAEPYFTILDFLCRDITGKGAIYPEDCETRTFLHDIPVAREFTVDNIVDALKKRKSVVIPGEGIVAFGTVSPEQAFVTYSSVCFAGVVKFFTDYVKALREGSVEGRQERIFREASDFYRKFMSRTQDPPPLLEGPFKDSCSVIEAITEVGRLVVDYRLVDSFFGNISYLLDDMIYITQTSSSLDELSGCIDACPLDGSSCAGVTASSELTAHRDILLNTGNRAILHGHPKFSVVMSMICDINCDIKGRCHIKCPEKRFIGNIPVVPGEVGTGPHGLCNTLPPAIKGKRGAIVYGHGVFTAGKQDFRDAFANLADIEKMCFREYMNMTGSHR